MIHITFAMDQFSFVVVMQVMYKAFALKWMNSWLPVSRICYSLRMYFY